MEVVAIATGYVRVKIVDENKQPIEHAQVNVYADTQQIKSIYTKQGGMSEDIALPAPHKQYSLQPSKQCPYALYHIEIIKSGYAHTRVEGVQIFADIASTLPIELTHSEAQTLQVYSLQEHALFTTELPHA